MVRKIKLLFQKRQIKEAKKIAFNWAFQAKQKALNAVPQSMRLFCHKVRIGG